MIRLILVPIVLLTAMRATAQIGFDHLIGEWEYENHTNSDVGEYIQVSLKPFTYKVLKDSSFIFTSDTVIGGGSYALEDSVLLLQKSAFKSDEYYRMTISKIDPNKLSLNLPGERSETVLFITLKRRRN